MEIIHTHDLTLEHAIILKWTRQVMQKMTYPNLFVLYQSPPSQGHGSEHITYFEQDTHLEPRFIPYQDPREMLKNQAAGFLVTSVVIPLRHGELET